MVITRALFAVLLSAVHGVGEGPGHAQQVARADGVLEVGQDGLGSEVDGGVGVAAEQHCEGGVAAQAVCISSVEIAGGEVENELAQQVGVAMADAGRQVGSGEAERPVAGADEGVRVAVRVGQGVSNWATTFLGNGSGKSLDGMEYALLSAMLGKAGPRTSSSWRDVADRGRAVCSERSDHRA